MRNICYKKNVAESIYNKTDELEAYLLQEGYCVIGIAKA